MTSVAEVDLAELLAALSFATDLASGVPPETSLRTALVAVALADALGVSAADREHTFFVALLRHLGCTSWSVEAARLAAGEDQQLLSTFEDLDARRRVARVGRALRRVGRGTGARRRATAVARVLSSPAAPARVAEAQCDQAVALAGDLGLPPEITAGLAHIYERHDGRGPGGVPGAAIALPVRLMHTAQVIEIASRHGGRRRVDAELEARSGGHLDPALCALAAELVPALEPVLEAPSVWERRHEASPRRTGDLRRVARAFAHFIDLKSAYTVGHSPAVAELVSAAAAHLAVPDAEREPLVLAALLHDLGAASVPTGIWDSPQPLTAMAWERVRLHAYWTERILSLIPALAPLAAIAGAHHERLDGSGYPRAVAGPNGRAGRLLAAADAFTAMCEHRAHRPALPLEQAAAQLRADAEGGRLCRDACAAVLVAREQAPPAPSPPPAGLTAREVEVLVLLARGASGKEIAADLGIAVRTARHHIEHIYEKIGVTTRAAAALFAARHELVRPGSHRGD